MRQQFEKISFRWLAILFCAFAVSGAAQVKSSTTAKKGPATHVIKAEKGEVVSVAGRDLVVLMDDGELRHFPDVPANATATVNGKQLTIRDLKPGMKLERTTITSTTPRMITSVKTVTGKVSYVLPPSNIKLLLEDGTIQSFKIPNGQTFVNEGKEVDAWHLRNGMVVTATVVTETLEVIVAQSVTRTGTLPVPPPEMPKGNLPLLVSQK